MIWYYSSNDSRLIGFVDLSENIIQKTIDLSESMNYDVSILTRREGIDKILSIMSSGYYSVHESFVNQQCSFRRKQCLQTKLNK